jgi:hypothetical protein
VIPSWTVNGGRRYPLPGWASHVPRKDGRPHSPHKDHKHTEETRQRMSQRRKGICPPHDKSWTPEEDELVRSLPVAEVMQRTGRSRSSVWSRRVDPHVPDGRFKANKKQANSSVPPSCPSDWSEASLEGLCFPLRSSLQSDPHPVGVLLFWLTSARPLSWRLWLVWNRQAAGLLLPTCHRSIPGLRASQESGEFRTVDAIVVVLVVVAARLGSVTPGAGAPGGETAMPQAPSRRTPQ